jgi:hypothetical protein
MVRTCVFCVWARIDNTFPPSFSLNLVVSSIQKEIAKSTFRESFFCISNMQHFVLSNDDDGLYFP